MSTIQVFPPPNNSPITQAVLWQYSNTSVLSKLIFDKYAWYLLWDEEFWIEWVANVFNLITANDFGLSVWSIILDVPLFLNTGASVDISEVWGFNAYVPPGVPPTLLNTYQNFGGSDGTIGANFSAVSSSTILTTEQQRFLLRLKFLKLISRCSVPQTNYNLNWLMFSSGQKGAFDPSSPVANPLVLTGTTTLNSNVITGIIFASTLIVGMGVNGTNIPSGSVITAIDSINSVTISKSATGSATSTLSFGIPTAWLLEDFDMRITYQFNFFLPSILQRAIRQTKVLPVGAGVLANYQYWDGSTYVNF